MDAPAALVRRVVREGDLQISTPSGWRQHYAVVLIDGARGLTVEFYDAPGGCFEGQFHCSRDRFRQVLLLNSNPAMHFQISDDRTIILTTLKSEDYSAWFEMFKVTMDTLEGASKRPNSFALRPLHKSGYLFKTGPSGKSWRKRWFVLMDHVVRYYKRPNSSDELGVIELDCCLGINLLSHSTLKDTFAFTIEMSSRVFNVAAPTEALRREWLRVLVLAGLPVVSRSSRSTFYVSSAEEDSLASLTLTGENSSDFPKQTLLDEYLPVVTWLGGKFKQFHESLRPKCIAAPETA